MSYTESAGDHAPLGGVSEAVGVSRRGNAPGRLRADIETHIAWLNHRIAALNDDLDTTLRASPVWRERETLYRSVPGIGPVCARTLVLALPELGTLMRPHARY